MNKDIKNDQDIVKAYLKYYQDFCVAKKEIELSWAVEYVDDLAYKEPSRGLEITIKILKTCNDDGSLAYVAAGPLENLFVYHGEEIIKKIQEIADEDERIQLALSGVWLDENEDKIYPQWYKLMERYNFVGKNPREAL